MQIPTPKSQAVEFAEVLHRFISVRSRLKVVLPEDLAKMRSQLIGSHPGGISETKADFNLLYRIGVVLNHQTSITMGELSRNLDIPLSTATRIMDWFVTNGFAKRLSDPADRRIVHVALTPTGQAIYKLSNDFIRKRAEKLLRRFTPEERTTFVVLLNKLADALEEEL
jgi:DNA-binding MarR family transcriptional regulator